MLGSLITPAFLPYGRVLAGAQRPEAQETALRIDLAAGETAELYESDAETVWDYGDGMSVLIVETEKGPECFYLDRAVAIGPGVRFGFAPLNETSVVFAYPQAGHAAEVCGRIPVPPLFPQIRPVRMFTFFHQESESGFYFRGEKHPPYELIYMEKGCLHNYCGGRDVVLRPRELLLVPPEQWHMQYADEGESVRFVTISFLWDGRDFGSISGTAFPAVPGVQRQIRGMCDEWMSGREDAEEYLNAQLRMLLLDILRSAPAGESVRRQTPAAANMKREIIDRSLQAVSAHVCGRYSVGQLAAAANVSATYLSQLFRQYIGISPAKYITRVRLEECKTLLLEGKMSVGEISELMGYASIQHFSKQFRQWVGVSPAAFVHGRTESRRG